MNRVTFLFLFFLFSCELSETTDIKSISYSDFIEFQDSDYVLIDVRTPEEYDLGHIPNALNYDFYSETFQTKILTLSKNESVILYCRTKNRSNKTAKILREKGFKEIFVIEGGITEWVKNGNDINYTTHSD